LASSRLAASGKVSVDGLANTLDAGTLIAVVYPPLIRQATASSPLAPLPEASSVAARAR
jgi:hypothetical protein